MEKKDKRIIERFRKIVGKAINEYELIRENDKVLVAVSGGRDSLVLLDILAERRKHLPIDYEIIAVHVVVEDMKIEANLESIQAFCSNRDIRLYIENVRSGIEQSDGKSPCFVCSWNKRKRIFDLAGELKCNKVAFGHHMDDALETLLMNMTNHGEISSIPPKIKMFDNTIEMIRPLITLSDAEVKEYATVSGIIDSEGSCEHDVKNNRNVHRVLIQTLSETNPNARKNLFRSMSKIAFDYLPPVEDNTRHPK